MSLSLMSLHSIDKKDSTWETMQTEKQPRTTRDYLKGKHLHLNIRSQIMKSRMRQRISFVNIFLKCVA